MLQKSVSAYYYLDVTVDMIRQHVTTPHEIALVTPIILKTDHGLRASRHGRRRYLSCCGKLTVLCTHETVLVQLPKNAWSHIVLGSPGWYFLTWSFSMNILWHVDSNDRKSTDAICRRVESFVKLLTGIEFPVMHLPSIPGSALKALEGTTVMFKNYWA